MTLTFVRCASLMLCTLSLFPLLAAADSASDTRRASVDFATCTKPEWPKEALEKRQYGTVKLEFDVAADGQVRQSRVVATSFHPLLDHAARRAIERCRLTPALERGKPVPDTLAMQYVWALDGAQDKPLDAPPKLAEFIKRARVADAIVDRYQRCLAFPDLPGTSWPAGQTARYCAVIAGRVAPDTADPRAILADLAPGLQARGHDWNTLVGLLAAYRFSEGDAATAEARGRLLLDLAHDAAWAVGSLRKAMEIDPARPGARYEFGRAQLALSEYRHAEEAFVYVSKLPEWKDEAAFQMIQMAADQDRMVRVGQLADAFVASHPEQPRGHYMRALAHVRAGEDAAASAAFATFLRLAGEQNKGTPEQLSIARRYVAGDREGALIGISRSARKL